VSVQEAECTSEEPQRLFQNCLEHRREIAGLGINDLQHLGGRGLLLQRLVPLRSALGKLTLQIGYELLGIGYHAVGGGIHLTETMSGPAFEVDHTVISTGHHRLSIEKISGVSGNDRYRPVPSSGEYRRFLVVRARPGKERVPPNRTVQKSKSFAIAQGCDQASHPAKAEFDEVSMAYAREYGTAEKLEVVVSRILQGRRPKEAGLPKSAVVLSAAL
jgi:hypothetical protein